MTIQKERGFSLVSFTLIGVGVALALFLGTFILSSRAKTPNQYSNLFIPVPEVPREVIPTPPAKEEIIPFSSPETIEASPSEQLTEESESGTEITEDQEETVEESPVPQSSPGV